MVPRDRSLLARPAAVLIAASVIVTAASCSSASRQVPLPPPTPSRAQTATLPARPGQSQPKAVSSSPRKTRVAAAPPTYLSIPSVGLSVAVGRMQVLNGIIDPPTADIVYWLSNFGSMAGTDSPTTVFIAGHSWSRGQVPFNLLYNTSDPQKSVQIGSLISLTTSSGRLTYRVQQVQKVPKSSVDRGAVPVMTRGVPGRLVLMTCAWYQGGLPPGEGENVLVTAQLVR
jgi:hypothetical protein